MPRHKPVPSPPQRARIYVPLVPSGMQDEEARAIAATLAALLALPRDAQRVRVLHYILRRLGLRTTDLL